MKKHLLLLGLVVILGGTFVACKKKYQVIPPPTPTSAIHDSIAKNILERQRQTTISGWAGGGFVTDLGIEFTFPDSAFRDVNGDTVIGPVNIDYMEILDPSDMILLNKPTMSSNFPLVSGGTIQKLTFR